ncbi:MAG: hypothetical protein RL662_2176 [Bacteroidota bacterium]|jgi:predicted Holliday junction resolvase-like endonuclease
MDYSISLQIILAVIIVFLSLIICIIVLYIKYIKVCIELKEAHISYLKLIAQF